MIRIKGKRIKKMPKGMLHGARIIMRPIHRIGVMGVSQGDRWAKSFFFGSSGSNLSL